MRILIIIDGLSGGGAEKVVLTIANGLTKMNHQVSIFLLREICDYEIPELLDIKIIQDKCKNPWNKLTEVYRKKKLLDKAIIDAENNGKFDIVFSHLHKTDRIVANSHVLERNKVWFCIHGILSFAYLNHKHGISRWFKYLKIRSTYKNRNVVAVSLAVLNDISNTMKIPLNKGVVIRNPFDVNFIQKKALEPFEMQGKDYIIHVGRIHNHKRHDRLLRSFAISKINIPLVIIGNGPVKKILELKMLAKKLGISDLVIFRPFTINPYAWIKGARLLVLSSDCEGFGNVLVEAIICKTPVVSTHALGGPIEILTGNLTRGIAETNDESLAKVLIDIYTNPPTFVDSKDLYIYDINVICRRYASLINK